MRSRALVALAAILSACGPLGEPCGEGLWCLEVEVPLDWSDPDGNKHVLDVELREATGRRIGPLVLNYGGPGAGSTGTLHSIASAFPELGERFDLVAIDPRGTEVYSPFWDCMDGLDGWLETEFDALDPDGYAAHSDAIAAWLEECRDVAPGLLAHMGTRDTVADFEEVREVLGGEPFTYVGFSYGTILGQVYAETHPDSLRAIYLDAVARPGGAYFDFLDGQVDGFTSVFDQWQGWCAEADPLDCPIQADPYAAVDDLFTTLRASPLPRSDGRDLTYARAWHGVLGAMYSDFRWPGLAEAVQRGLDGDPEPLMALSDGFFARVGDTYAPLLAIYYVTSCSDLDLPPDEAAIIAAAGSATEASPLFGAGILVEPEACLAADLPNDPLPATIRAEDAPTILLVIGENDPATPESEGLAVAENLADARVLKWTGNGHGALFRSECVTEAARGYLVDLALPSTDSCD